MKYKKTGIREAKAQFCSILRDVTNGTEVIITERGKPVAKIIPITEDILSIEEKITHIEGLGWIEPIKTIKTKTIPSPFSISGENASKFLEEARRI